jgi:hypothetical protein
MEKNINELIKFYNELFDEIKKFEKNLLFIKILNNKKIEEKITVLPYLQSIINQSFQLGNYRRALKFIILLNDIVKQLPKVNDEILNEMTNRVI